MLRLRRIPRVRQHDVTDCGAACLSAVAQHFGLCVPIARIRQFAATDQRGTNVLGMVEAAERLGFCARGVRAEPGSLASVPTPTVAHVVSGGLQHFVVLFSVSARRAVVMDPADGRVHRVPLDQFHARWTGVLLLIAPSPAFRGGDHVRSPLRRFWDMAAPHRTLLAQAVLGAAAYTVLGLSTAVYVQKLVDYVIADGNRALLNLMSVAMLCLIAAQVFIGSYKNLLCLRTGQRIDAALILGYVRHLLRLPQPFFDTMRVGEIVSRVNDAVKIRTFVSSVCLQLLVDLLVVAFSLALMLAYSPRLAMVAATVLPLYGFIYALANARNRRHQRTMMERAADLESQLVESITSMGTVKRLGLEDTVELRTETRLVRLLGPVHQAGITAVAAGSGAELVSRCTTVALLWIGTGLVLDVKLSPGELMSFYALIGYLTGPVAGLITANQSLQDARIATDRLFEILDLEVEDDRGVELTRDRVGDISIEGVRFRYGSRADVFEDLRLTLPRGQITAIVGESGSGKSTLAALLHRTAPLQGGRVRIGEMDLRHFSVESLRRTVCMVPQRVDLFAGDVVDNIAVGDSEPDLDRVLAVCERLRITEFVEALPMGFRTPLGENGATLSGGQRQRLAIARALYRDPKILVLDEATAALDPVAEHHVRRVLRELAQEGCAVVQIAHRLTSVTDADRILVLQDGRVAEQGSHGELLARRGSYHRLWRYQTTGGEAGPPAPEIPARAERSGAEFAPGWITS